MGTALAPPPMRALAEGRRSSIAGRRALVMGEPPRALSGRAALLLCCCLPSGPSPTTSHERRPMPTPSPCGEWRITSGLLARPSPVGRKLCMIGGQGEDGARSICRRRVDRARAPFWSLFAMGKEAAKAARCGGEGG